MFYCTLTLNREQYEKIKDMPELKEMATETYEGKFPETVELCNYKGNIMPAELVLQSLKIPYVAYLDKTSEGPALERVYNGNKIIERDLDS